MMARFAEGFSEASSTRASCPATLPGCSVTVARVLWEDLVPVQIRAARLTKVAC